MGKYSVKTSPLSRPPDQAQVPRSRHFWSPLDQQYQDPTPCLGLSLVSKLEVELLALYLLELD